MGGDSSVLEQDRRQKEGEKRIEGEMRRADRWVRESAEKDLAQRVIEDTGSGGI